MKRVLLIVTGGIAAYKALELVRLLRREGISTTAVLTEGGARFVTAMSLQALTENKVYTELWSLTDESEMGHIQLSRAADLLVVVPASANTLAKMAAGLADDLASTVLLATDKPVLVAPAMNVRMWSHPATIANMAILASRGVLVVGPDEGAMACNEYGPGRLAEPAAILTVIKRLLEQPAAQTLAGRHALVTSGPTFERIDPVRYLANRSSGRQGHAIAAALADLGARVTLVSGPVAVPDPVGVTVHRVETGGGDAIGLRGGAAGGYRRLCGGGGDWRVVNPAGSKLKKSPGAEPPRIELAPNPDILATLAAPGPRRPRLVVGFAAETDLVLEHAGAKRARKGCDWIVANDVRPETGIMGGDVNEVHLVTENGIEHWPLMPKTDVAARLAVRMAEALA